MPASEDPDDEPDDEEADPPDDPDDAPEDPDDAPDDPFEEPAALSPPPLEFEPDEPLLVSPPNPLPLVLFPQEGSAGEARAPTTASEMVQRKGERSATETSSLDYSRTPPAGTKRERARWRREHASYSGARISPSRTYER